MNSNNDFHPFNRSSEIVGLNLKSLIQTPEILSSPLMNRDNKKLLILPPSNVYSDAYVKQDDTLFSF